jgi:UDP-glucose 4-epimerase
MNTYLVTGVAGFIGSKFATSLLEAGHKVVGIDNLSTGFIDVVPEGVEFLEAGVHDVEFIKSLETRTFDGIVHIAGQSGGEMSYEDPVYDLQSNAQSTLLLLNLARKINCKRVVFASTVSVYGDLDEPDLILENSVTLPKSFYGVGKLASENYLRIYAEQFGLETVALRLFNTYGPGQNLSNFKQGMASIYLAQAIKHKHIHVKGAGNRYRDLVYIDDVVDAFNTMLNIQFEGYRYYNVATGKKTKVSTLVDLISNSLPYHVTTEYSGSTPGDVFGYSGDITKITSSTGWKPKICIEEGVCRMTKWALATQC